MHIKNQMVVTLMLGIFCMMFSHTTIAQSGYYYRYTFKTFLNSKLGLDTASNWSSKVKYPPILRENEIEGYSRFMIKSNGEGQVELIQMEAQYHSEKLEISQVIASVHHQIFQSVKRGLAQSGLNQLKKDTEKYFTEFTISFDIAPHEEKPNMDIQIRTTRIKTRQSSSHLLMELREEGG